MTHDRFRHLLSFMLPEFVLVDGSSLESSCLVMVLVYILDVGLLHMGPLNAVWCI